ncbi:hypothetical protein [Marichromatium gracile]|nr:hypothetical protein [Marichromatium gracile]
MIQIKELVITLDPVSPITVLALAVILCILLAAIVLKVLKG